MRWSFKEASGPWSACTDCWRSVCHPAFNSRLLQKCFSPKQAYPGRKKRACEGSLRSSVQTGHGPDKSAEKEIVVLVQVPNKSISSWAMFYLSSSLVLILQFRLWFRECLRFIQTAQLQICSWEIVQQVEKWKPELSLVNCVILILVSPLIGSTRPSPVVLNLFCETCSLLTILAGVGDAILKIKTPRFSNQTTWLLSRDCFIKCIWL